VALELGAQASGRNAVPGGNEDRVVAGDRPGDVRVARLVDRLRESVGEARRRGDDDEVAGGLERQRKAAAPSARRRSRSPDPGGA
jgi:hypothetical protein